MAGARSNKICCSEPGMCNDYRLQLEAAWIFEDFADLKINIRFPESCPTGLMSSLIVW